MIMTTEEARKVTEDSLYDIDQNQGRMIMTLGKLQEAKELIDEADAHNQLDELLGTLPVMSGEIGKQVYELKKILGIEPNSFEKEVYEQDPKKEVIHDYLGLYELVDELY
ncbi:hypothetical protein, partial [Weissella muntiaci]|uniref:hypothetical protein n=1 Tax=Weissella muntiaci TaxID=2508881 RepID=UPI00165255E1